MKYLSFITVLILLATLFSFVFTQLNKDETKHEYGIAFPLEESESRLPPLSSVIQSESDVAKPSSVPNVESLNEATTTTETIATSTKTNTAEQPPAIDTFSVDNSKSEETVGSDSNDGSSLVIETIPDSANSQANETESEVGKDDSSEEGDQPATNPKLIFIERLMGMNFQRAPGNGFSSFLEMRDSVQDDSTTDDNKNATKNESNSAEEIDSTPAKDSIPPSGELPWGNALDSLRSRWESRIRKFTFPFQNSYSVVLRTSSVADADGKDTPTDNLESSESDNTLADKAPTMKGPLGDSAPINDLTPASPNKYYFQSAGPLSSGPSAGPAGQQSSVNPQTNQLLRMAALSMMSKLFSALRNQVYTNPKMDGSSNRFAADHHDGHDLDLDDDEDDSDLDSDRGGSGPEGLPVPIIIAHRPRINVDASVVSPYGYGGGEEQPAPPMRTAIMYGRPSPAAAHQSPFMLGAPSSQRYYGGSGASAPMSPLGAILAAAMRQQQQQQQAYSPRGMDSPAAESQQPQRLILLITHRPSSAEPVSSPRMAVITPRDEQPSYHPSAQSMAHYAPLSAPSSPIYYHLSPQSPAMAVPQPPQQPRVVEVPVPIYMPMMMRMGRSSSAASVPRPPMMKAISMPRLMPESRMVASAPEPSPAQSGPGHMAILYYHSPEQESSPSHESVSYQQPSSHSMESQSEPEGPTMVRFLLRPRSPISSPAMTSPIVAPIARMAFHRRLDDSDDEPSAHQVSPLMGNHVGHDMMDGPRLRQWRDYSQFVRSAPAPQPQHSGVTHLLIASRSHDEPDSAPSEDHYSQYAQPSHPRVFPIYHPGHGAEQEQQQAQPQPQQFMFAHAGPHHQAYPRPIQGPQQQQGSAGPHAAFFILAEPHGAQQENNPNNDA